MQQQILFLFLGGWLSFSLVEIMKTPTLFKADLRLKSQF